ncbi:hypothetical protein Q7P37_007082 [Cladosporium fusiforme]
MADNGDLPPNATIYVRNLDESVKIPVLIQALHEAFDEFGTVVDIVAKKSLKRKGQAFVVYDNVESAKNALEDLQDFPIFDEPMKLAFAKTRSDATVEREDGETGLEQHKAHRIAEKERKQAQEAAAAAASAPAKRRPEDTLADRPAKNAKPAAAAAAAGGAVPDEYLPPNKTLFLRDLPENYGQDSLAAIFKRYPGFREIRLVPGRNTIAFAEYEDDTGATAAKEALSGIQLSGQQIKITFQRQ